MNTFDHEIILVDVTEGGFDDDGFPLPGEVQREPILANKLSVRSSEYWQANQSGVNLSYVFEVHTFEYNDEERLVFEGEPHVIKRTFEKGDLIELVCERFKSESE